MKTSKNKILKSKVGESNSTHFIFALFWKLRAYVERRPYRKDTWIKIAKIEMFSIEITREAASGR